MRKVCGGIVVTSPCCTIRQEPPPSAAADTVSQSTCTATHGDCAHPHTTCPRLQPVWSRACQAPRCLLLVAVLCVILVPRSAWPCACGCGVFEVGTPSLLPSGTGGQLWVEYDFQDQYRNWSGTTSAPASANGDRRLRTNFVTVGAQYMFNRSWGAMLEVPYAQREFASVQDNGKVKSFSWNTIGDIRLWGMYTGLSEDMTTGLLMGVKFASGWFSFTHADRDTQIGSGSTDLLLGAYHIGTIPRLTIADRSFGWYGQVHFDIPLLTQGDYHPGWEFDGAVGTFYDFGPLGFLGELAPFLTLKGTNRVPDSGLPANPANTGYGRMLIAPGIETRIGSVRLYADIAFPIYQNVNGDQIISPVLVSAIVSYSF
jgi:hypothetical protein